MPPTAAETLLTVAMLTPAFQSGGSHCFGETFWLPLRSTAPQKNPRGQAEGVLLFSSSFPPCGQADGFCIFSSFPPPCGQADGFYICSTFLPHSLLAPESHHLPPRRHRHRDVRQGKRPHHPLNCHSARRLRHWRSEQKAMGLVVCLQSGRYRLPFLKGASEPHHRLYTNFHPADEVSRDIQPWWPSWASKTHFILTSVALLPPATALVLPSRCVPETTPSPLARSPLSMAPKPLGASSSRSHTLDPHECIEVVPCLQVLARSSPGSKLSSLKPSVHLVNLLASLVMVKSSLGPCADFKDVGEVIAKVSEKVCTVTLS